MGKAKLMCAAALLLLLLLEMDVFNGQGVIGVKGIDCGAKCRHRCSKSSRQKMCIRACKRCCRRCNCVPPGTSGNEDVCPCYSNMKTHDGRHKCP